MRIFFVGDFEGNNGPASVNKALRKYMPESTLYSVENQKLKRVLELFYKISKCDVVLFSGLSKINILGLQLARIQRKKAAYLMHGCIAVESKINNEYNERIIKIENKVLKIAPKIICVSKSFMNWMKENYPQYKDKLDYVNNGIDFDLLEESRNIVVERDDNTILSVGGGMPMKNIKAICKAISVLNKREKRHLKLIVIGKKGKDTDIIKSYPFVTYLENVPKNKMVYYYKISRLYIQNSIFETFGLAPIEALMCGCNLLISNNIGAKDLFRDLDNNDLIYDVEDINEIATKIIYNLKNNNNIRLLKSIDKENTTVKASCEKLINILRSL